MRLTLGMKPADRKMACTVHSNLRADRLSVVSLSRHGHIPN